MTPSACLQTALPLLLLLALSAHTTARLIDSRLQEFHTAALHMRRRGLKQSTSDLPVIAVVTTGGTIASVEDENGNLIPAQNGTQLLAAVPGLEDIIQVGDIIAAAFIDSSTATPQFWVNVSKTVRKQLRNESVDGVLLLHGSDTMEQTAWFLQCIDGIGNANKPVVLTGAMEGASSPWADGPQNIYNSAIVLADPRSHKQGVMVSMAGEVHSSRYVTKAWANDKNAMGDINGGAVIGSVIDGKLVPYFELKQGTLCHPFPLPKEEDMKGVALQQAYPGADGAVIPFYVEAGMKGLVINGLGAGNIGAGLADGVEKAQAMGQRFSVVVTRSPANGISIPSYGCPGCLGNLTNVAHALNMDAFRARIVLMLAISNNPKISLRALQNMYDKMTYPKYG